MRIGIDIDATITAFPGFFRAMTEAMYDTHQIHIITDRDPAIGDDTVRLLADLGIRYHHLAITRDKHDYVLTHHIDVLFDDTDEYFRHLPPTVAVFKTRQRYNFDFTTGQWLYTPHTGRCLAADG